MSAPCAHFQLRGSPQVNWGEARSFCKTIGGDLLTLHDGAEKFHELVHLLREHRELLDVIRNDGCFFGISLVRLALLKGLSFRGCLSSFVLVLGCKLYLLLFFLGSVLKSDYRSLFLLHRFLSIYYYLFYFIYYYYHFCTDITTDFWVGGSLRNETEGWTWVDGAHMELGTPYWTIR